MRMYPREFPATRRRMPKRRAERRIFEALAGSDRQGFAYYEWRRDYGGIELDFAVWIVGLGRFALQVKGGRYLLAGGEWFLKTKDGPVPIGTSPLEEAWLAALDLHDDIEDLAATPYNPHVIPVLTFCDMEPDKDIEGLARRKGVRLVWRTTDLVADLCAIAQDRRVADALPMDRIRREVSAVTDGLIQLPEAPEEEAGAKTGRPAARSPTPSGPALIHVQAREARFRRGIITGPAKPRKRPAMNAPGDGNGVSL